MKKIIAAAVAAAVIAPVSVMAAGPVLYGKIQMSVNYLDNNGSGDAKYNEASLNSNHSRIGVKGSEDLGNGMKVGYLIEWAVDMDGDTSKSGAGDLAMRNRAVTLSGDWGTVLAGQWDTPVKTLSRKIDMFGERLGDTRNLNTGGVVVDARTANTVAYVTPNMNGFSSTIAYVFDVRKSGADDSDGDAFSVNGIYNNGPLLLGAGYENISDGVFGANAEDQSVWRLVGSYKIGDFKILGGYTDVTDGAGIDGHDTYIWSAGGSYAMGNNTIKLQYTDRSEYDDAKNTGADQWAIGLDHAMSKRTTVYVEYATLSNDDNSTSRSWNTMGNDARAVAGEDTDGFGVGIVHKF